MEHVIIIADSLTQDFMSPDGRFMQDSQVHIGQSEVARLLGRDEAYGDGPLPEFLESAHLAKHTGASIHTILLRDLHDPTDIDQQYELIRYGLHNIRGTEWADFVPAFQKVVSDAEVINTSTLMMPTGEFRDAVSRLIGKDVLSMTKAERDKIAFIVCGAHTNIRVLNTSARIRNDLQFSHVIVSPHLSASRDSAAHLRALQVDIPNALVKVVPSLGDVWKAAGLDARGTNIELYSGTQLNPPEVVARLSPEEKEILKTIFMEYGNVRLRQLSGGFSGSKLFLVDRWIRWRKAVPVIVKMDSDRMLFREVSGYAKVKPHLGNHIPTIDVLVSHNGIAGAKIVLASMEGNPATLQGMYEESHDRDSFTEFFVRLKATLRILSEHLYENCQSLEKCYLYRELGLQASEQRQFLEENIRRITGIQGEWLSINGRTLSLSDLLRDFSRIARHADRTVAEIALSHGDLNLANIISDDLRNIWMIDWTHAGERMLELDFAKLENDMKFVLMKDISEADLPVLEVLESYLVENLLLPKITDLPHNVRSIIDHDFRFEKMYESVREIRNRYLSVRRLEGGIAYRSALLRYSTHSLSFDRDIGRGECHKVQLTYAFLGTALLIQEILKDPIHSFASSAKSKGYPERYPVPVERHAWTENFPEYQPKWVDRVSESLGQCDGDGIEPSPIPLNPAWRTGIHGRGELFYWGKNQTVDPVVLRRKACSGKIEVLLVRRNDSRFWELPGTFVNPEEDPAESVRRGLVDKIGWDTENIALEPFVNVPIPDDRNTDNAWVETTAFFAFLDEAATKGISFCQAESVSDVAWIEVDSELMDHLYANHAEIVQIAVSRIPVSN